VNTTSQQNDNGGQTVSQGANSPVTHTASHTSGPWQKVFINGHWHINKDGFEIAKVTAYKNHSKSTRHAQLICASPELLSALVDLLAWKNANASTNPQTVQVRDAAKAAIARTL